MPNRLLLGVAFIGLLADATGAQELATTGIAAVDSAASARAAWGAAIRAMRTGDTAAAIASVTRAAKAWPLQPAYSWSRALLAAQRGDTLETSQALDDFAALGLGADLTNRAFDRFREQSWFAVQKRRHDANRAPHPRSRVARVLADSMLWPEGVDYDAATGKLYVTSVRHHTIVEVSPDGSERELWPRHSPHTRGAVLAVRVDRGGEHLWATISGIPQSGVGTDDSTVAALLQVRIADGAILQRFDLNDGRSHVLGDVAVVPDGTVLFSDSVDPALYLLRRGASALETIRSPLFRSLQGVAITDDPASVYIADYSHGILRLNLATRSVTRVWEAPGIATLGVDGLQWNDGALIAIQNGVAPARVMRFELSRDGARIDHATLLDRNPEADEPTSGTIVGSEFVYVANSLWEKHDHKGQPRPGAVIRQPTLLAVPLDGR